MNSSLRARVSSLLVSQGGPAAGAASNSVAQRVLFDLKEVILQVQAESTSAEAQHMSARARGNRLLYLFQRDLLPGISGKILEAKGSRDNIIVTYVSRQAKAIGWTVLALLNLGMWSYIILFALSQTVHKQGAWAMSFVMFMVVDIFFVSSCIVIFTHIALPSLIMQDVKKIKQKLVENIQEFNRNVQRRQEQKRRGVYLPSADEEEQERGFNAAKYLFVSNRLASEWPELKEAQIISQFRTPWPKQSYRRENDVSGAYNKRYTALYRSASVIAIFFLTQLLQIPSTLQDMIIQMATTAVVGYTVLGHIDLYHIYPALAFIPAICATVAVYWYIQRSSVAAEKELCRVQVEQKL